MFKHAEFPWLNVIAELVVFLVICSETKVDIDNPVVSVNVSRPKIVFQTKFFIRSGDVSIP